MTDKTRNPLRHQPRNAEEVNAVGIALYGEAKWNKHMAARERQRQKAKERGIAEYVVSLDAFVKGKPDD
ncbi:hypothetical protein [Mesorhizobium sp. 131-2-1]|uniref:hypothetical protein n=1 Tax=Mesorhizobium sp. 131-2-1 TaxID=2744518 RepID=UPI00192918A3|nr:hypothetical protein [Mesorhizobium sp. 131-2-1]BCG94369.1 hypothetical protein MesoLj131a_32330 [Mesorhizobium sp. 131-2-1]